MKICTSVIALALIAAAHASAAQLTIDNFESYTPGTISAGAASTPWLTFGTGAGDQIYASTSADSLLAGTKSGRIPIAISGGNTATTRRNYGTANDFSSFAQVSVLTKSLAATPATQIQLSISNGSTTFLSAASAETPTAQTLTFLLTAANFTNASGTNDTFATVIAGLTSIGFRISSPAGAANEVVAFDSFVANTVPEPASLAALATGCGLLLRRRR